MVRFQSVRLQLTACLLFVPAIAFAQPSPPPALAPNGDASQTKVTANSTTQTLSTWIGNTATTANAALTPTGDASNTMVVASGSSTPRALAARATDYRSPSDFGAAFGGADVTIAINNAIAQKSADGGGIVLLPPGTGIVSGGGIIAKSGVHLIGSGARATFLKCATSPCVTQNSANQLSDFVLTDINLQPSTSAYNGATVLSFTSINQSEIGRLLIEGFSNGQWLNLGGTVPTNIIDSNLGGNVTWNNFHDVTVYGCGTCSSIQGVYGTPSGGNPGSPTQVVTQNIFSNINLFYVTTKGWDIVAAADTNDFFGGLVNLIGTGSIGVVNGDDASYAGLNNYVNSNKFFGLAFSSTTTSLTMFSSLNYTFAIEGYGIETDIDVSQTGVVPLNMPYAQSYRICGKRLYPIASGVTLGCLEYGIAGNLGQVVAPSTGFYYSIPVGYGRAILSGSGTFATGSVILPCGSQDGDKVSISTTALTVTAITFGTCSTNGGTIYGAPASLSATTPVTFQYIANSNSWVRI